MAHSAGVRSIVVRSHPHPGVTLRVAFIGGIRQPLLAGIALATTAMVARPLLEPSSELAASRLPAAFVSGLVFDSLSGNPLIDVSVFFTSVDDSVDTPHVAITDSTGRYELSNLRAGRYIAGFTPTPLDSMGIESPSVVVTLRDGPQSINLATPSAATITRAICRGRATDSTALLLGHVRDTRDQRALVDATVVLDWNELIVRNDAVEQRGRILEARTNGPGWFAVCDLPGEVFVTLRASHGADTSGFLEIPLAPGGLHHVTFLVGGARSSVESNVAVTPGVSSAQTERITAPVWYGGARLSGVVRDDRRQPVSGATVSLWGTYRSVLTNERGTFSFDSLPGGTQTMEVRLIGFEPVRQVVHLAQGRPLDVDVVLGERVVVLEGVQIVGKVAFAQRLAQFERRRRMATSGYFLGPRDLERRPPTMLARLVQGFPGVQVACNKGECVVTMRGQQIGSEGPSQCVPSLWVDGRRDMLGDFGFLYTDELAAVEVYTRDYGKPPEFNDLNACGAVVVWTRPAAPELQRTPR